MIRCMSLLLLILLPAFALSAPPPSAPATLSAIVLDVPDGGLFDEPSELAAAVAPMDPAAVATPPVVSPAAPHSAAKAVLEDADVLGHGQEAFEAVQAARRAPTLAGIAAAIVAGIMLLISVARRFGGLLLTSNQVRLFVVAASALAGGVAHISDGMGWTEILFVALAPVVSVGVHQVFVKPVTKG